MKVVPVAVVASSAFLVGITVAAAQTPAVTSNQEAFIQEHVSSQEVEPAEISPEVTVEVGAILPDSVELHPIDTAAVDLEYEYVVLDGRTILVDPMSREIMHVIDE